MNMTTKMNEECWWGGGRLGRGGIFNPLDFSVHSNGLKEVDQEKELILTFGRDDDAPWVLRKCTSSLKLQTTMDITTGINLLELGK